jgi:hypothetical protein
VGVHHVRGHGEINCFTSLLDAIILVDSSDVVGFSGGYVIASTKNFSLGGVIVIASDAVAFYLGRDAVGLPLDIEGILFTLMLRV